jgi:hypothetical protein
MVVAAIGTVLAAGYLLWLYQRTAFGTPTEEFADDPAHPRRHLPSGSPGADARAHPRARRLPQPLFGHRRRGRQSRRGRLDAGGRGADRVLARGMPMLDASPGQSRPEVRPRPTSTGTRSRPSSSCSARIVVVLLVDVIWLERTRAPVRRSPASACWPRWSRCSPWPSTAPTRSMFGGAYVVDDFALVLKALFLVSGYVVVLLSTNYIAEGDYWEGEYYFLLLASMLGMVRHGLGPRPHHDLRGPRAAVDPRLHARRLAQARPARATRPG